MTDWEERKQRILDLLDTTLSEIPDNPVYENYGSRNIVNYLTAIKQIDDIMRGEEHRKS